MACRDFFVQPYQFDPESDPEGEAPEEEQLLDSSYPRAGEAGLCK